MANILRKFSVRNNNNNKVQPAVHDEIDAVLENTGQTQKIYTTLKSIEREDLYTDQYPGFLFFKDNYLEKEFAEYYYGANQKWRFLQVKLSLLFLTAIYVAYVYWDLTQLGFITFYIALRFASAAVMFVINILTLFNPINRAWNGVLLDALNFIFFFSVLVPSTLKSVMSHKFGNEYPVGLPITIIIAFIAKNIRLYIMIPLIPMVMFTYVTTFVICYGMGLYGFSLRHPVYWVGIALFNILGFVAQYSIETFFRRQFLARKKLKKEQGRMELENKRNEQLLLNILPIYLIPPIKQFMASNQSPDFKSVIMEKRDNCSVLFSDIVMFTAYSSKTPAQDIVFMLNHQFSVFDALSTKLRLEKVKTIGDAYFAVGNLKGDDENHCEAILDMACGMMTHIARSNAQFGWDFRIRVGIAHGTIFAGVLGNKKFTFDCFGSTVLLANEMEAASIPGCIHVTEEIRNGAIHSHDFYDRGMTEVEPFGHLHTYLVLGRKGKRRVMDEAFISTNKAQEYVIQSPLTYTPQSAQKVENDIIFDSASPHAKKISEPMLDNIPIQAIEEGKIAHSLVESDTDTISADNADEQKKKKSKPKKTKKWFNLSDPYYRLPFLLFFKDWRVERDYFSACYAECRGNVRGTLFLITAINFFYLGNFLIIYRNMAASATAIIMYIVSVLQLIVAAVTATPLGNTAIAGLIASILSMALNYIMMASVLFNQRVAYEYVAFFGIITVMVLNLPPNLPWVPKQIAAISTVIVHLIEYMIYGKMDLVGLVLNFGMLLLMAWVSFFVDLASRRSYVMTSQTQKELSRIEEEQERNQNLVLSALPLEIANRLKVSPESTFDAIKDGSVCFAKLCGFDDQMRQDGADHIAILNVLNELFTYFDEITALFNCTKIKSIGATFMAVSSCPTYTADHAVRIAHLAKAMMKIARVVFKKRKDIVPLVNIRIGIMCGDFVAGVLGETKYLFDVFGNSVNVAARMSTTSEKGTIQCCEPMFDLLKNHFKLTDRGTVFVKGKGDLQVWTVEVDDDMEEMGVSLTFA